jgi:Short C-terminal domain
MMRRRRGPGLVGMAVGTAVVAGTAGAVRHHQEQKYANQAADQQAQQQAIYDQGVAAAQAEAAQQAAYQAPPPTAAAPAVDLTAELQKLASLKQAGILTDEEFAAAKAKLLG